MLSQNSSVKTNPNYLNNNYCRARLVTLWQRGGCVEFYSWMLCGTAFSTSVMSWNPDRWSGVWPAPASVLVVLEVLILAGYLQDGRSGIPSQPRGPADISPEIDPSSLPVPV